jgi:diguanylate cyclase (GGDEF)-like protein
MDHQTLVLVLSLLIALNAAILLLLHRLHREMPGPVEWAIGATCIAAGAFLDLIGSLPFPQGAILLANWLVVIGYALVLVGMRDFCGQSPRPMLMLGLATLALLPLFAMRDVDADFAARSVLVSAIMGAFSIAIAATLEGSDGVAQRITAGVFSINAVVHFLYGAWVLAMPVEIEGLDNALVVDMFLLWTIGLTFATGAALTLMISEHLRNELLRQASHDPLTDLLNRRGFDLVADKLFATRSRDMHPFSVMMIDLDHFKRVNDTRGHEVGDRVLVHVSRTLANHLRAEDVFARWGGEEFVVLMPNCAPNQAREAAQRLRAALALHPSEPKVTLSVGTASSDGEHSTLTELQRRADAALYEAKRLGRDRAVDAADHANPGLAVNS